MSNAFAELPPLKCFQHCNKDIDLVCFMVPNICPICLRNTIETESRIPPYILPSPFSSSSQKCTRSVVLKPTQGDFIRNYVQTCNLHIGVSDKDGFVYDFDEKGLKYGPPWQDCLAFDPVPTQDSDWDSCLWKVVNNSELWKAKRYHEERWNCFDFVLHFIKLLAQGGDNHRQFIEMSKTDFTTLFLTEKTRKAEQYIHLYRQVIANSCVRVMKQDSS